MTDTTTLTTTLDTTATNGNGVVTMVPSSSLTVLSEDLELSSSSSSLSEAPSPHPSSTATAGAPTSLSVMNDFEELYHETQTPIPYKPSIRRYREIVSAKEKEHQEIIIPPPFLKSGNKNMNLYVCMGKSYENNVGCMVDPLGLDIQLKRHHHPPSDPRLQNKTYLSFLGEQHQETHPIDSRLKKKISISSSRSKSNPLRKTNSDNSSVEDVLFETFNRFKADLDNYNQSSVLFLVKNESGRQLQQQQHIREQQMEVANFYLENKDNEEKTQYLLTSLGELFLPFKVLEFCNGMPKQLCHKTLCPSFKKHPTGGCNEIKIQKQQQAVQFTKFRDHYFLGRYNNTFQFTLSEDGDHLLSKLMPHLISFEEEGKNMKGKNKKMMKKKKKMKKKKEEQNWVAKVGKNPILSTVKLPGMELESRLISSSSDSGNNTTKGDFERNSILKKTCAFLSYKIKSVTSEEKSIDSGCCVKFVVKIFNLISFSMDGYVLVNFSPVVFSKDLVAADFLTRSRISEGDYNILKSLQKQGFELLEKLKKATVKKKRPKVAATAKDDESSQYDFLNGFPNSLCNLNLHLHHCHQNEKDYIQELAIADRIAREFFLDTTNTSTFNTRSYLNEFHSELIQWVSPLRNQHHRMVWTFSDGNWVARLFSTLLIASFFKSTNIICSDILMSDNGEKIKKLPSSRVVAKAAAAGGGGSGGSGGLDFVGSCQLTVVVGTNSPMTTLETYQHLCDKISVETGNPVAFVPYNSNALVVGTLGGFKVWNGIGDLNNVSVALLFASLPSQNIVNKRHLKLLQKNLENHNNNYNHRTSFTTGFDYKSKPHLITLRRNKKKFKEGNYESKPHLITLRSVSPTLIKKSKIENETVWKSSHFSLKDILEELSTRVKNEYDFVDRATATFKSTNGGDFEVKQITKANNILSEKLDESLSEGLSTISSDIRSHDYNMVSCDNSPHFSQRKRQFNECDRKADQRRRRLNNNFKIYFKELLNDDRPLSPLPKTPPYQKSHPKSYSAGEDLYQEQKHIHSWQHHHHTATSTNSNYRFPLDTILGQSGGGGDNSSSSSIVRKHKSSF